MRTKLGYSVNISSNLHSRWFTIRQLFGVQTDFKSVGATYKNKSKETLHLTTYINSLPAYIKAKLNRSFDDLIYLEALRSTRLPYHSKCRMNLILEHTSLAQYSMSHLAKGMVVPVIGSLVVAFSLLCMAKEFSIFPIKFIGQADRGKYNVQYQKREIHH